MGAVIVPFQTRAQREERLHRELTAAYRAYVGVETPVTLDALVQALERLIAFQRRHSHSRSCNSQDMDSTDSKLAVVIPRKRRPLGRP